VNGRVVREPGHRVASNDVVKFEGRLVRKREKPVYILLNKPKDVISTTKDEKGRTTVIEIIRKATKSRVYPVGRLDRNTVGLLLLTNDGDLAEKLTHPSHEVKKIYHVFLSKPLTREDFQALQNGLALEDGFIRPDEVAFPDAADKTRVGLTLHSGRNRIVRRMFDHLGYTIEKLDRVYYGGLTKKNLPRGKWRYLNRKEVILLKHFV